LSTSPSVSKANPDRFRRIDDLALGIDQIQFAHGRFDGDGADMVLLVADHTPEALLFYQFHRFHAESHPQHPVEAGRAAAPLDVPEAGASGLLASEPAQPGGDEL